MGYFANGTEGEYYQNEYCYGCIHWKEDDRGLGCPVWDLHLLHNAEKEYKADLDMFIPREGVFNKQCVMYLKQGYGYNKDQLKLELE